MVGKEPIISVAANFKQVTGSYLDRRTPNNIVPAICLKVTILSFDELIVFKEHKHT